MTMIFFVENKNKYWKLQKWFISITKWNFDEVEYFKEYPLNYNSYSDNDIS
jgi:hypothetical protein